MLVNWLTVAKNVVDRCWSTCWQVLIKQLIGADQAADRCWSTGSLVLIKRLSRRWSLSWLGDDTVANRRWSSGWQVLIKWLTGADQAADSHWSSGCLEQIAWPYVKSLSSFIESERPACTHVAKKFMKNAFTKWGTIIFLFTWKCPRHIKYMHVWEIGTFLLFFNG